MELYNPFTMSSPQVIIFIGIAEVAERKTRWTQDPVDISSMRVQIPPSAPYPIPPELHAS